LRPFSPREHSEPGQTLPRVPGLASFTPLINPSNPRFSLILRRFGQLLLKVDKIDSRSIKGDNSPF
jgi:hypothetical protein